jgi:hypothetical protein
MTCLEEARRRVASRGVAKVVSRVSDKVSSCALIKTLDAAPLRVSVERARETVEKS